jgi:hypothetical protein
VSQANFLTSRHRYRLVNARVHFSVASSRRSRHRCNTFCVMAARWVRGYLCFLIRVLSPRVAPGRAPLSFLANWTGRADWERSYSSRGPGDRTGSIVLFFGLQGLPGSWRSRRIRDVRLCIGHRPASVRRTDAVLRRSPRTPWRVAAVSTAATEIAECYGERCRGD